MSESADLSCFALNGSDTRLYYLGDTGNLHEAAWRSDQLQWHFTNITTSISGAPTAAPAGALTSFASNGTESEVFFLDGSAHLCRASKNGQQWTIDDLTHVARPFISGETVNVPRAVGPLTCFGYQDKDARVYFLDGKSNVCQMAWENNEWVCHDLTQSAGAPPADKLSALTCFGVENTDARVYFVDSKSDLCEIASDKGSWGFKNLTGAATPTDASQPVKKPRSNSALCCFGSAGKDARVYFIDDDSHLCQMAFENGHWEFTNVSAEAVGPAGQVTPYLPAGGTQLACNAADGQYAQVYYLDAGSFVWQMARVGNEWVGFGMQLEANSDAFWAPAAFPTTALASTWGETPRVYYMRWQRDINELSFQNGQWVNRTIVATVKPSNPVAPNGTLEGNNNYSFASSDINPLLTYVVVTIDVTQPLVVGSDGPPQSGSSAISGMSFQLNAISPKASDVPGDVTEVTAWQQYVLAMVGNELVGIVNSWTTQENSQGEFDNPVVNTYGNPANLFGLPSESIPAGYRLTIALWPDANDNVYAVSFCVMDENGIYQANETLQLSDLGVSSQDLAPVASYQLDIVGPGNSEFVTFAGGLGVITFNAFNKITPLPNEPSNVDEEGAGTFENSNLFYGELPITGVSQLASSFAQPFKVGAAPQ